MPPLVSIITPTYNRADYLDETIRSVLNQDYPDLEYIVLDDGSADDSLEIVKKYSDQIIWDTHPNMGETNTVNKGFGKAKGELVCVVNSDDPLLPGAVRTAVDFMVQRPDILVAYPDWVIIDSNSKIIEYNQVSEYSYIKMLAEHRCIVGPGAFIRFTHPDFNYRRDPQFRYVADFDFWLRLGLYGEFARIPETLASFRVHPESATLSHTGKLMSEEHIRLVKKIFSLPNLPAEAKWFQRKAFGRAYYRAGLACGSHRSLARLYYLKSVILDPDYFIKASKYQILMEWLPAPIFNFARKVWHTIKSAP